jgi:hypothetical protein
VQRKKKLLLLKPLLLKLLLQKLLLQHLLLTLLLLQHLLLTLLPPHLLLLQHQKLHLSNLLLSEKGELMLSFFILSILPISATTQK